MSIDATLDRLVDELAGIHSALDQLVAVFTAADGRTERIPQRRLPDDLLPGEASGHLRASHANRAAVLKAANTDPNRWWTRPDLVAAAVAANPHADTSKLRHATADLVKLGQLETNGRNTSAARFRAVRSEAIPGEPITPRPDPAPAPATPTTAPPAPEPTGPEPQAPSPPTPDVPDIEPTPGGYSANGGGGGAYVQRSDEARKLDERLVLNALNTGEPLPLRAVAEDTGLPRRKIEDVHLPELIARGLVIPAGHGTLEGELWTLTTRGRALLGDEAA